MPPTAELITLARAAALRYALDPALVCGIVEQESDWDPHAIRYEPAFRAHYVAPLALPPSEEIARSISWGLMQVMGQVAREHGFAGKFLSALCDPQAGLEIGCAVFAAKLATEREEKTSHDEIGAPSAANSSSRPQDVGSDPRCSMQMRQGTGVTEIERALQRWNGGANLDYAAEVLARVKRYR